MNVTTVTAKGATTTAAKPAAAAKPSLSESQRQGAIDRASEAAQAAARIQKAMPQGHQHTILINRAATAASVFAIDAAVASGVADAQYASRKAIEAAAAAGWLFAQRV